MGNEIDSAKSLYEESNLKTRRNIFNKLRLRSKSVVNLHRDKASSFPWFSRKPAPSVKQEDAKDHSYFEASGGNEKPVIDNGKHLSSSHHNLSSSLNPTSTQPDEIEYVARKAPSYISISLLANGYSKNGLSLTKCRSGDVHAIGADAAKEDFKSAISMNNQKPRTVTSNDVIRTTKTDGLMQRCSGSYIVPIFEILKEKETVEKFEELYQNVQTTLSALITRSELLLEDDNICEEAKEAILVAAGHTRVLLKSKIRKMAQLIEKHKETDGQLVTLNDLGSFWDMLDIEILKSRKQFEVVEQFHLNQWKPLPSAPLCDVPCMTPKSRAARSANSFKPKVNTPRTDIKEFLAARRKLVHTQVTTQDKSC